MSDGRKLVWKFGDSRENLYEIYRDSCEKWWNYGSHNYYKSDHLHPWRHPTHMSHDMLMTLSTEIATSQHWSNRAILISWYLAVKTRSWFNLNLYRGIWLSGFGGFRGCCVFSGIHHTSRDSHVSRDVWKSRVTYEYVTCYIWVMAHVKRHVNDTYEPGMAHIPYGWVIALHMRLSWHAYIYMLWK